VEDTVVFPTQKVLNSNIISPILPISKKCALVEKNGNEKKQFKKNGNLIPT